MAVNELLMGLKHAHFRNLKILHDLKRLNGGQDWISYQDLLTGFDIVRFDDEVLHSAEGESCADVIKRKYGNEALKKFEKLMDAGETN